MTIRNISYLINMCFLFTLTWSYSAHSTTSSELKIEKNKARIKTIHGDVVIQFFPNSAPNTVKRISQLINEGFYNGLIFHRVVADFVVQGGDPTGTGTSGSGKKLMAEFNDLKHVEGSVAMARSADPNSADSQFYICLGEFPHLDRQYTVFGKVVEGMDAVKKIKQNDKMLKVTTEL
jgi:cyclophilin family peptidyl-prolyl cis-trans isomerase